MQKKFKLPILVDTSAIFFFCFSSLAAIYLVCFIILHAFV